MHFVDLTELYCSQIKNSSAKIAFFTTSLVKKKLDHACGKSGFVIEEKYDWYLMSHMLNKGSLVFETLNDVAQLLMEGGIVQRNYENFIFSQSFIEPPKQPKVLSIGDLSFGFIIWMEAAGVSSSAFMIELLIPRVKATIKTWTKLIVGVILFLRHLRDYLMWIR